MLRVDEFDSAGPAGNQVAQVMQHAGAGPIAEARLATARARQMRIVAAAPNDLRLGQILRAGDALGGVGYALAWTGHDKALHGDATSPWNLRHCLVRVMATFHALVLKTRFFRSRPSS